MWLAPATQNISRKQLRRRTTHNSNCLKSVRSVWKVLSRFESFKRLYHLYLPLSCFRRVNDKTCADQLPLKSLHPKRVKNKICFSVFWRFNQKVWVLKQLLPNLFKKNSFVDEIGRYLKSKKLNLILLFVLLVPPASMHSWYCPSKYPRSIAAQEDHLAPPATWPRNNDDIQEVDASSTLSLMWLRRRYMLGPVNIATCMAELTAYT